MPPSSGGFNDRAVGAAAEAGHLDMAAVDVAATRVTALLLASRRAMERRDEELDGAPSWARSHAAILAHNHELARQIALESAVLLKNERDTLPLPPPGTALAPGTARVGRRNRLAVIGSFATNPRYQGAGSPRTPWLPHSSGH